MRISVPAAALLLGSSLALAPLTVPTASAVPNGDQCAGLGVANLYGEFIEGDDSHSPDAEGAVAVGGNFSGTFTVGNELTAAQIDRLPGKNAFVVAGNVSGNVQVMKGNGVYGGTLTGKLEAHQGKIAKGPSPIDFAAEFAKLRAASTQLAAAPANGKAVTDGNALRLTGTDQKLNHFVVPAEQLEKAKEVHLTVPAGAVTVVTVTGGSYDQAKAGTTGFLLNGVLDDKLQSVAGGAVREKLLWNFPTATQVVKNSGNAWPGSVLAPNAHFDLGKGGPVNGSVIAKSLVGTGGAETHHYPFTGCLPVTPSASPSPSTPGTGPSPSASTSVSPSASPSPSTPGTGSSPQPSGSGTPSAGGSGTPSGSATTPGGTAPSASPSSPGGGLAFTGASGLLPLTIGGVVIVGAGAAVVVATRRRKGRRA
ncbi:choice-of-anchor A family protein [Kitasatospora sp. NPDC001664]